MDNPNKIVINEKEITNIDLIKLQNDIIIQCFRKWVVY